MPDQEDGALVAPFFHVFAPAPKQKVTQAAFPR